jgi:molybdopterin-binding protein
MPRKEQGWITFQTSEEERKLLEEYCQQSQRTKTEILRELVRNLTKQSSFAESIQETRKPAVKLSTTQNEHAETLNINTTSEKKPLKVSSRNILKGVVTEIVTGLVNSEITLEITHRVKLTSVITKVSVEELEIEIGKDAYAVIKSTDIVIASD